MNKNSKASKFGQITNLLRQNKVLAAQDKLKEVKELVGDGSTNIEKDLMRAIEKSILNLLNSKITSSPKISIITVVYNDKKGLERTIHSVQNLNYRNIEFIVIDGGSNDGTQELLKNIEVTNFKCVSEKDDGIYDAMNKGIYQSNSDYCIFMNAGDEFASTSIIQDVFTDDAYEYDVVYGDRYYIRPSGSSRYDKAENISYVEEGMAFCHQAVFVKTSLMKNLMFDLNYKFAADYDLFCKLYKNGKSFKNCELPICRFYSGGASESGLIPYIEVLDIQRKYFGKNGLKKSKYLKAFKDKASDIIGEFFED